MLVEYFSSRENIQRGPVHHIRFDVHLVLRYSKDDLYKHGFMDDMS